MRETVIVLLFCVIINQVTSTTPFNLPKISQPPPKTTTPSTTTKLPKWNNYGHKNSTAKPVKDNAYLATLVNMPPKDKTKNKIIITKEGNITKTEIIEKECLNTTRILFAEEIFRNESKENEISASIETSGKAFQSKINNTEPKKGVKLQELLKPLLTKPKTNNTDVQPKSFELPPTMIPIFKQSPNLTKNQVTKDNLDATFIKPEEATKSSMKEVPTDVESSKEIKPNLKPNPTVVPFNIPCHRASDVLDDTPVKSEKPQYGQVIQPNLESVAKAESPISQEPNQVERPEKLDTDESVAVIFKPKNISLLNVYGDMLKKITLTVLVPYHISKLGT